MFRATCPEPTRSMGATMTGWPGGTPRSVGPTARLVAGPLEGQEGIVYAAVDADHARKVRRQFDPVGHYARSAVLRLVVDCGAKPLSVSAREAPELRPWPDDEPVDGK